MSPDFPDIPLGGWVGTVQEIDQQIEPISYLVKWNQHTLDQINPVYRKRCERDDLELETMWLDEDDLEVGTSALAKIEQPSALVTRPLSQKDQDDRIRTIFGLTSDDPLPRVTDENLHRYHSFLATHLSFPFQAKYTIETEPFLGVARPVDITALLDPEECDDSTGFMVEAIQGGEPIELPLADLEEVNDPHNGQLIEDYAYWFVNCEDEVASAFEYYPGIPFRIPSSLPKRRLFRIAVIFVLWAVMCGVALGSLLASMELARISAGIGAAVLGSLGLFVGSRFGMFVGILNQIKSGSFWGGILGTIVGAVIGAMLGAMAVAFVGLLTGGLIGAVVSEWVSRGKAFIIFLGSMAGATVQTYLVDQEQALIGGGIGGAIGAGVAIIVVVGLRLLIARKRAR